MTILKFQKVVFMLILIATFSFAQNDLRISRIDFCENVQDYKLKGMRTKFSNKVGLVYCFTKVEGATDTTTISHIWYYDGKQKAKVDLKVKSNSWRTYSSKRILKTWTGTWRVDVVDEKENVLKSKKFMITSSKQNQNISAAKSEKDSSK